MAEKKGEVVVTIQGTNIEIKTEKDPQYVQRLAEYVDDKMQKISQDSAVFVSTLKAALLAALTIADELNEIKDRYENLEDTFKKKTERLIQRLQEGLK